MLWDDGPGGSSRSRLSDAGVELRLPDGRTLVAPSADADEVLSEWIGRPVSLVHAESFGAGVGEFFTDATDDASAVWAGENGFSSTVI